MKALFSLAFPALLAAALPAQTPITAYGYLKSAAGPSTCMDNATHYFLCSNLRLRPAKGANPGMKALENKWVRIEGKRAPSIPICPMVEVTKAVAVTEHLEMPGTVLLGGKLAFSVYGNPGSFAALLVSPYKNLLPLGSFGSLYLSLNRMITVGSAIITNTGKWAGTIPIPNVPALQYMRFRFQPVLVVVKPSLTAVLANVSCMQIR